MLDAAAPHRRCAHRQAHRLRWWKPRDAPSWKREFEPGTAVVAFSLHPVDVQDLMAITDAGGIMPPKSTWFEPKLRDGLLSHLV